MAGKPTAEAPSTEENEVYRNPATTEREARRAARTQRRSETGDEPAVVVPSRPTRSRPAAPAVRIAAVAGVIAIGVVIGVLMEQSAGWLVGLVVSLVTLALAAVLSSQLATGRGR